MHGVELGDLAARRLALLAVVDIQPGVSDDEFDDVEARLGFQFADDHRAFLAAGLPAGRSWPDWRHGDTTTLRTWIAGPVRGVLFDVEHGGFWHPSWGERPGDRTVRQIVAARELAAWPQLVPISGHRYLPAGRGTHGHPVLSIHQTDVIYYGSDIAEYIHRELARELVPRWDDPTWTPHSTVAFWTDILLNDPRLGSV